MDGGQARKERRRGKRQERDGQRSREIDRQAGRPTIRYLRQDQRQKANGKTSTVRRQRQGDNGEKSMIKHANGKTPIAVQDVNGKVPTARSQR